MHKCAKAHCQLLGCNCLKERYLSTGGGGVGRGHLLIPDTLLRISLKQGIVHLCKYITGFPAHVKSCNQTIHTKNTINVCRNTVIGLKMLVISIYLHSQLFLWCMLTQQYNFNMSGYDLL